MFSIVFASTTIGLMTEDIRKTFFAGAISKKVESCVKVMREQFPENLHI